VRFLHGPAAESARLVIAGDLFDFWVSPAQTGDSGLIPVLEALRGLVDAGVAVGFVEGNRDFAAARELAELGVARLPDVLVLEQDDLRAVVTHGDLLCTKDVRYQAFRRLARSPFMRHVLRQLPSRLALGAGKGARKGSALETARKTYGDMGLEPLAVASLLREHEAQALICGHVHWGKRYTLDVDGLERDVVVLSAWENAPTYARLHAGRLDFVRFE